MDCFVLDVREKVTISTSHFVGGVADKFVNDALVDPGTGKVADEAMT